IENLAGADFTKVRGLSESDLAVLRGRSAQELGTWNSFTRSNTGQSLGLTIRESI
ncbi:MAG: pentapeptide repeat-containing protein, partial [Okeania sp. SIO2H7]|nr:pentapeptide repeat-containing protein [Okeania sp. SIO2H7]